MALLRLHPGVRSYRISNHHQRSGLLRGRRLEDQASPHAQPRCSLRVRDHSQRDPSAIPLSSSVPLVAAAMQTTLPATVDLSNRPLHDKNNVGPRVGFAWDTRHRTHCPSRRLRHLLRPHHQFQCAPDLRGFRQSTRPDQLAHSGTTTNMRHALPRHQYLVFPNILTVGPARQGAATIAYFDKSFQAPQIQKRSRQCSRISAGTPCSRSAISAASAASSSTAWTAISTRTP